MKPVPTMVQVGEFSSVAINPEIMHLSSAFLQVLRSDDHTRDDTVFAAGQLAAAACHTPLDAAMKLASLLEFSVGHDDSHQHFQSAIMLGVLSDLLRMTVMQHVEADE